MSQLSLPLELLPARDAGTLSRATVRDALIVCALLALQLVYWTGIIGSDDLNYVRLIDLVRSGEPIPQELHYFVGRFLHWGAMWICMALLPGQRWALALPTLVATAAMLLMLRAAGRRYLGESRAWLPMVVFGLCPVTIVGASVALPDPLAAALAWGGVLLALPAILDADTPRGSWRCALAGLLIAAGYSAKESVVALVPLLVVATMLVGGENRWRRAAMLVLGATTWVGLEAILMFAWLGNPFFHAYGVDIGHQLGAPRLDTSAPALAWYFTDYVRWLIDPAGEIGPFGPAMLAALVLAIRWRTRITNVLLIALLPTLAYLTLGSVSVTHYQPVVHQPRYLIPILPGLALLASVVLAPRLATRVGRFAMIAAIVWACIAPNAIAGRWYNAAAFEAGYALLAEELPTASAGAAPRVVAAGLTVNRVAGVHHWLDLPSVERIAEPPQTAREWRQAFAGVYVLTSRYDRIPPADRHRALSLHGASLAALESFPRVARREPPASRLGSAWAKLIGRPVPTDPAQAFELRYIPPAEPAPTK